MVTPLLMIFVLQGPGDSLTLMEALAQGRAMRAQGAVAAAQVAEARGALRQAGAIPNPILSYSHSEAVPTNHLLVDQPLDWLFRRGFDRTTARAGVARARADSAQVMLELEHGIRLAYWRTRASMLSKDLVETQAIQADSLARIAAARLRAGDISLLEEEQAAQEAARAHQTVSSARESARVAEVELLRAIGAEAPTPLPTDPLDAGLDRLPDSAIVLTDVPLLRGALADSVAAAAQVRSAARSRLPIPSLQAGSEWGDPAQPGALSVVGFSVPFPLWHRGAATVTVARARAQRVYALTRETRLDVRRQARLVRIQLEESARRARTARDSLVPAAAVLRSRALKAYQAGETGILPVLEALRSEREVTLSALQDQLAFQQALAGWYALAGRAE
jgi:outer membrane protein, heavy metal efflux system